MKIHYDLYENIILCVLLTCIIVYKLCSPLSVRFPRLFDLAENKTITVAALFSLGLEQGGVELEA